MPSPTARYEILTDIVGKKPSCGRQIDILVMGRRVLFKGSSIGLGKFL
jgi:hypothetical protein